MSRVRASASNAARRGSGTVLPRGQRLPQPDLVLHTMRGVVLVCLLLVVGAEPWARWAEARAQRGAGATPAWSMAAHAARFLHEQPLLWQALLLVGVLGCAVMIGELLTATFLLLPLHGRMVQWGSRNKEVFRIRSPQVAVKSGARLLLEPDHDVHRAIHQALPPGGRVHARTPWVAWTMLGQPDQPAELGLVVAGGTREQRARIAAALTNALVGAVSEVQVDPLEDPLAAHLATGRVVAWREWRLHRGSHYPIRLLDDVDGGALLGPILAALRPRGGTMVSELQIIVRPIRSAKGWKLHQGWRGRTMALKLKLEAKADYALAPDIKALEAKLGGAAYELTVRATAIAHGAAATEDAQAALDALGDALGAYHARTGGTLQRFVVDRSGMERVRGPWSQVGRTWPWLLGAAGVAAAFPLDTFSALLAPWRGRWPLLSPTRGFAADRSAVARSACGRGKSRGAGRRKVAARRVAD